MAKPPPPAARKLLAVALVVFAAWNLGAILSARCLYADGAHEFIRTLVAQNFYSLAWHRQFSYYIMELPLVAAIHCGVTDLGWLRLAFGLGCYLPWPIIMLFCHWLSPRHFWVVLVACAAGYLNAAYMAIGEHIIAHAFFWPVLFALLFARPLKPLAALILLTSAACLLFSYESQLFLGLPLAALSLWRLIEDRRAPAGETRHRWAWLVWLLTAALCLTASGIGLHGVLKPDNPAALGGFQAQSAELLFHPGWTFAWTALWLGVMLAVAVLGGLPAFARRHWVRALVIMGLVLWATWPLLAPGRLDPARQFHLRLLDLAVPLALLPVCVILQYRPRWLAGPLPRLQQLAAVLLIVQSGWHLSATWQWHQDLGKMQALLQTQRGVIHFQSSPLATSSLASPGHDFDWSLPCLSLAITPSPHIQSLVCAERYVGPKRGVWWQPFDPLNLEQLPDLRHYGLDYDEYILARRSPPPP